MLLELRQGKSIEIGNFRNGPVCLPLVFGKEGRTYAPLALMISPSSQTLNYHVMVVDDVAIPDSDDTILKVGWIHLDSFDILDGSLNPRWQANNISSARFTLCFDGLGEVELIEDFCAKYDLTTSAEVDRHFSLE